MKTLFNIAALGLSLLATTAGAKTPNMPEDELSSVASSTHFAHRSFVTRQGHQKLNIIVRKEGEPVQVRVTDELGTTLYRTKVSDDGARLPLNVSYLEPGLYKVELRRNAQVEVDTFEVK